MKMTYIKLAGKQYPLAFSLSAVEGLCRRFGSLEGMEVALSSEDTGTVATAIDGALVELMAAGRAYAAAMDYACPPPLPAGIRPADLIPVGDGNAMRAIFEVMRSGTERTVEVEPDPKNGVATQGD